MIDHKTIVKRAARMQKPLPRFDFGKYKGRAIQDVFRDDPSYIVWCWQNVARHKLPFIEETYLRAKTIVDQEEADGFDPNDPTDMAMNQWAMEIALE